MEVEIKLRLSEGLQRFLERSPESHGVIFEGIRQQIKIWYGLYCSLDSKDFLTFLYGYLDSEIRERSEDVAQTNCFKKCSDCCSFHVDVFDFEREHLFNKFHELKRSKGILEKQAQFSQENWVYLPKEFQKCVFLEEGKCSIYEDRPFMCRKYYVRGESPCVYGEPVDTLSIYSVEVLLSVLNSFSEIGTMPKQIIDYLYEGKNKDKISELMKRGNSIEKNEN